jgi:hypothetical protein
MILLTLAVRAKVKACLPAPSVSVRSVPYGSTYLHSVPVYVAAVKQASVMVTAVHTHTEAVSPSKEAVQQSKQAVPSHTRRCRATPSMPQFACRKKCWWYPFDSVAVVQCNTGLVSKVGT